jgi:hypothetical protein
MDHLALPLFRLKILAYLIIDFLHLHSPSVKEDIDLHHVGGKPFILKVYCTKGQLILSYGFSKSNFKISAFCFFLCVHFMYSFM